MQQRGEIRERQSLRGLSVFGSVYLGNILLWFGVMVAFSLSTPFVMMIFPIAAVSALVTYGVMKLVLKNIQGQKNIEESKGMLDAGALSGIAVGMGLTMAIGFPLVGAFSAFLALFGGLVLFGSFLTMGVAAYKIHAKYGAAVPPEEMPLLEDVASSSYGSNSVGQALDTKNTQIAEQKSTPEKLDTDGENAIGIRQSKGSPLVANSLVCSQGSINREGSAFVANLSSGDSFKNLDPAPEVTVSA